MTRVFLHARALAAPVAVIAACSSSGPSTESLTTVTSSGSGASHASGASGSGASSGSGANSGSVTSSGGSSTPSSGGGGGGAACQSLARCCAELSAADAEACDKAVIAGAAATCSATLAGYQTNGLCGGISVAKDAGADATPDSGGMPGSQTDPTTCAAAAASRSYIGCDFWPTVTANLVWSGFDFTAVVANMQAIEATVTVTGPAGFSSTATVAPNALTNVYLPWVPSLKGPDISATDTTFASSVAAPGGAYHLVSNIPVAVYQFSALEYAGMGGPPGKDWSQCPLVGGTACFSYSNDASILLPSTSMTGSYRVTGEHGSTLLGGGLFAITGTQAETSVTVTLSSTASVVASTAADGGGPVVGATSAGGTMHFLLDAGDVIELMGTADDAVDLSGSLVQANKPVQVIAGRQCANQPDPVAACDHLESSVFPAETLGKDYVVTVPTSPHAALVGHKVRFYGNADGTVLTYSPSQPAGCPSTLGAGQVVECLSNPDCATGTGNSGANQNDPVTVACVSQSFEVTGTHEFAVSSFMLGGSAVDPADFTTGSLGDPSMSPMVATEQFRSRYVFLAPTDYEESYADVVVPAGAALTLDGSPVAAAPTVLNATWSIVRITLGAGQAGAHVVTGTKPFGVQVIGYGEYTSYQYPAGLDLAEIAPPPMP